MRRPCLALLAFMLLVGACSEPLQTPNKTYPPYGAFNADSAKSTDVCYEVSVGDVIISAVLFQTVVVPVYLIGWNVMEPVRIKQGPNDDCSIDFEPSM